MHKDKTYTCKLYFGDWMRAVERAELVIVSPKGGKLLVSKIGLMRLNHQDKMAWNSVKDRILSKIDGETVELTKAEMTLLLNMECTRVIRSHASVCKP